MLFLFKVTDHRVRVRVMEYKLGCICLTFVFTFAYIILAICTDGTLHKYGFSTEGNSFRESYDVFLNIGDDQV